MVKKTNWWLFLMFAGVLAGCGPDEALRPNSASSAAAGDTRLAVQSTRRGSRVPATLDDQFEAIDRDVGGFGGLFYDESGRANVYLRSGVPLTRAVSAIRSVFPAAKGLDAPMVVLPARYSFAELAGWRDSLASDAIDRTGLVFDDIDESLNRNLSTSLRHRVG